VRLLRPSSDDDHGVAFYKIDVHDALSLALSSLFGATPNGTTSRGLSRTVSQSAPLLRSRQNTRYDRSGAHGHEQSQARRRLCRRNYGRRVDGDALGAGGALAVLRR